MKCIAIAIILTTVFTGTDFVTAQEVEENPHVWKPTVKSVSVYKNGLGFFIREGTVTLHDGWCLADVVPPATFGTLSIYSLEKDETVDFVGASSGATFEFDDIDMPRDIETKRRVLESNKHLPLEIWHQEQEKELTVAGKLVSIGQEYIILKAEGKNFAVALSGINKVRILETALRIHVDSARGAANRQTKLGLSYLRKGIIWIPDYTLSLIDENTAELTLRGTLVNEAEDIMHADISFVAGVPNFRHTDYVAPIAIGQVIRTIGTGAMPSQVMSQARDRAGHVIDAQRTGDPFAAFERPIAAVTTDMRAATGNLPRWEGEGSSDFTVYDRKAVTLRQGEKAIVNLFTHQIGYGHVYRWSPPGAIRHYLVLHNNTDSAWTTGPCLVRSDERALSEELLKYVPINASGELPVTTAINMFHAQREKEVDRILKEHEPAHNFFVDRVTLAGTLTLRNFDRSRAEMIVDLDLNGRPLEASDDGAIVLNTEMLKVMERTGTIHWRFVLEPGEEKTLSYNYERYVPSR